MLEIQKFNYNWPGLIGSALLASGLDMIPYFGHALAVPALYICVWKMTRESIFPDAAFTVLFSYLFMFVVNMFLITYLMGDLRPDLHPDTDRAVDLGAHQCHCRRHCHRAYQSAGGECRGC